MATTEALQRRARIFDGLERVVVLALFGWLCVRFFDSLSERPANTLFLISEGLVVVMVMLRRSTDQLSLRAKDWVVGFMGTLLPLLLNPTGGGWAWGVALVIGGLCLSVTAKLSLGRSFGIVAANRGIRRGGIYSAVRHPMYLGYFISYAGVLLLNPSLPNAGLLAVWAAFQIARISAEERVLMRDAAYQAHAAHVRYRLLPFVY